MISSTRDSVHSPPRPKGRSVGRARGVRRGRHGATQERRRKVLRIVRLLERFLGAPRQSLRRPSSLDMLIATILSQNTNDKNSHRAYTQLRERFPTWQAVHRAPRRTLVAVLRTGGMARQKAGRIKDILGVIHERYGSYSLSELRGKSDNEILEELTAMNGVGVKTAACVLLFSLGRDVFPVDTHVHRLCKRLGLVRDSRSPVDTFFAMRSLVPAGRAYSFHTNLIRFGRKVCRAVNPSCSSCPLFADCTYKDRSRRRRLAGAVPGADHDFMLLDNI